MEHKTIKSLLILACLSVFKLNAQEAKHFRNTRLINSQTTEVLDPGVLEFRIAHRFGAVSGGYNELFGLDQATMRISLEQGVTKNLMVGIGRSTYQKTVDGLVKYRLINGTGKANSLSLTYFASINMNGMPADPTRTEYFSNRLSYNNQLILSKQLKNLTIQLMPTATHQNLVRYADDKNLQYACGIGGKLNVSKVVSLNGEYFYRIQNGVTTPSFTDNINSFSLGLGINTKGHFFELHVTNSFPLYEQGYIFNTTDSWLDGDIHFGFNLIRDFQLWKPKN